MNDKTIFLRNPGDQNHYIGWRGNRDGPRIQGWNGGELGTRDNKAQLVWAHESITINEPLNVKKGLQVDGKLIVNGREITSGGQGPQGERGPQGPQGPEGPVSKDPTFNSITVNTNTLVNGKITTRNGADISGDVNITGNLRVNGQLIDLRNLNTTNNKVNCEVSWGSWGGCSKTCGTGSQTRTATITRNPANGGDVCPALTQTQNCNTQACPTTTATCDKNACNASIDSYISRNWWYTSTDFGTCKGCPVVSFPNKVR